MSFDGKHDTGAKYEYCIAEDMYFKVMEKRATNAGDISSINSMGLIDAKGDTVIPCKYAYIEMLNDRYAQVCEATKQTTSKDKTLLYLPANIFAISVSTGDLMYEGKWYVYDTVAGGVVSGASGTKGYSIQVFGKYISYTTDAGQSKTVNEKGENLPTGARLFTDGYYTLEKSNGGTLYDTDDKKLFDYELDGFIPDDATGEYIIARKNDGGMKYVLMDTTGKFVSAEFNNIPKLYGKFIFADNKLYDFDGKEIIEGTYRYVHYDKYLQNSWFLQNGSEYTLIKQDGTVMYKGSTNDGYEFNTVSFLIEKDDAFYCWKDKDFTLKDGNSCGAPWLISVDGSQNTCNLVDTLSGETLIEDYRFYQSAVSEDQTLYIYALGSNGGIDIYTVK